MILNDNDRQNLILHILSKVDVVDGYSKLYNLMFILKREVGGDIFKDYKFDSSFLTIKDKVLDNDLNTLLLQRLADNDPIEIDLAHKHEIKINKYGKLHLNVLKIDKKLKAQLGNDTLKKIENLVSKYNAMSTSSLIEIAKNVPQSNTGS